MSGFQMSGNLIAVALTKLDLVWFGVLLEDSPLKQAFPGNEAVPLVEGATKNFEGEKSRNGGRAFQIDCPRLTREQRERLADLIVDQYDARRDEVVADLCGREGLALDAKHFAYLFSTQAPLPDERKEASVPIQ